MNNSILQLTAPKGQKEESSMEEQNLKKTLLERIEKLLRNFSFPTKKALRELIELLKEPHLSIDFDYFKRIFEGIINQEKKKGKRANKEFLKKFSELHGIFKNPKKWQS